MASKNESIERVLVYTLQQCATTNNYNVAWFGTNYSPVINTDYIIEQYMPNEPESVLIGRTETQRYRGIYQLTLCSSNTEKAISNINAMVEKIYAVFKPGYPINYDGIYVQIENNYDRSIDYADGWYTKVISIYYRTDI